MILFCCCCLSQHITCEEIDEPPEGYYAFVESPNATPPSVRPPPYTHSPTECADATNKKPYVSVSNLCGDLNKGSIPPNPMKQNIMGEPYPFELLRNHTLKFLSRTLPILKADETLPKVTQVQGSEEPLETLQDNEIGRAGRGRLGRANDALDDVENLDDDPEKRIPRKFCDGGGVFCAIYRAIQGEPLSSPQILAERRDEPIRDAPVRDGALPPPRYDGPPTPCPAKVEYATPVFAKNYQGAWRYVVQIPYEGYFTQTVEVTRCLQARCHYLDGGCLSSPRWVSLLVAEIFYPTADDSVSTSTTTAPSVQDFQAYQQYLQKRAGQAADEIDSPKPPHCDGHDEIGCFQVRLYYDWFLIPGSCKCWRPDYFARYVRRKNPSPDL